MESVVMRKNFIIIIVFPVFLAILLTAMGLSGTAQYTYDYLNRLVQVQYDDGTIIQYSYDAAGNRTVQRVTAPQPPEGAAACRISGFGSVSSLLVINTRSAR
jgi:YD repeat-containing protein